MMLQVCGEGEGVLGDAVVPLRSMFLDGAENVELPGVFHSMSKVGTYDSPGGVHNKVAAQYLSRHRLRTSDRPCRRFFFARSLK